LRAREGCASALRFAVVHVGGSVGAYRGRRAGRSPRGSAARPSASSLRVIDRGPACHLQWPLPRPGPRIDLRCR
jgi:hypothetical protein